MKAQHIVTALLENSDFNPEELVYGARQLHHPDLDPVLARAPKEFVDAIRNKGDHILFVPDVKTDRPWPAHRDGARWSWDFYHVGYSVKGGSVTLHLFYTQDESRQAEENDQAVVGSDRYEELKRDYSMASYAGYAAAYLRDVIQTQRDPLGFLGRKPIDTAPDRLEEYERLSRDPNYANVPAWSK